MKPALRLSLSLSMLSCLPLMLVHATAGAQAPAPAAATNWPTRVVTIIAPFAAGGPVDLEARIYAKKMGELTSQKVVVDYKPGAASSIGAGYVARAAADGYTLLVGTAGLPLMPSQFKNLPFDILRDLAPISQMSERTSLLITHNAYPPKNLKEHFAYAKANPEKATYGYSSGSSLLVGSWLHNLSGTKVTFVGYKGVGPASTDLMAGRLDLLSSTIAAALPLMKSGKIRALSVLGTRRNKLTPDLPTVPEQGVPEFDYAGNWFGFLAPSATPPAVLNRLAELTQAVARAPDVLSQLDAQGSIMVASRPEEFRKLIATEKVRWERVLKESGIQLGEGD